MFHTTMPGWWPPTPPPSPPWCPHPRRRSAFITYLKTQSKFLTPSHRSPKPACSTGRAGLLITPSVLHPSPEWKVLTFTFRKISIVISKSPLKFNRNTFRDALLAHSVAAAQHDHVLCLLQRGPANWTLVVASSWLRMHLHCYSTGPLLYHLVNVY